MSFNIEFDYRFAPANVFDDLAKQRLEAAAQVWEALINDDFPNVPAGTQIQVQLADDSIQTVTLDREIDDLLVFVTASPVNVDYRAITIGQYMTSDLFPDRFNGDDFMPWVTSIDFALDSSFANIELVLHELGHALGIGTAPVFDRLLSTDGLFFIGSNTIAVNQGAVPLEVDGHVLDNYQQTNGLVPLLDPGAGSLLPTVTDLAMLADLGYEIPVIQNYTDPTINFIRYGTDGEDSIFGHDGDDILSGGGGDDYIDGFSNIRDVTGSFLYLDGNDVLSGDAGDDYILGQYGNDILLGGPGDDYLRGGPGNDILEGGPGNDSLEGGPGADTFIFNLNSGEDFISNFDFDVSQDVIQLAPGWGFQTPQAAVNALTVVDGRDGVFSELILGTGSKISLWHRGFLTAANFVIQDSGDLASALIPPSQNLTNSASPGQVLKGSQQADQLIGTDGDDLLNGRSGNDVLNGGAGNDTLIGGAGRDRHSGGAGNDIFAFGLRDLREPRPDIILDFEVGIDQIDLQKVFKRKQLFNAKDPIAAYVQFKGTNNKTTVQISIDALPGDPVFNLVVLNGVAPTTLGANDFRV